MKQPKGWTLPVDLRERMIAATRRGTNLDPSPQNPDAPSQPVKRPQTIDERREKARVAARERRAREKRARLADAA